MGAQSQKSLRRLGRRARLIAQLHEEAIATANDPSARHNRRKAEALLIAAGAFVIAAGCILAVLK